MKLFILLMIQTLLSLAAAGINDAYNKPFCSKADPGMCNLAWAQYKKAKGDMVYATALYDNNCIELANNNNGSVPGYTMTFGSAPSGYSKTPPPLYHIQGPPNIKYNIIFSSFTYGSDGKAIGGQTLGFVPKFWYAGNHFEQGDWTCGLVHHSDGNMGPGYGLFAWWACQIAFDCSET